jgi:hypothetical protein
MLIQETRQANREKAHRKIGRVNGPSEVFCFVEKALSHLCLDPIVYGSANNAMSHKTV